jgi:internalin A
MATSDSPALAEVALDPLNSLPLIRYYRNLSDHFSIHQNLGLPAPGRADEEDRPLLIRDLFVEPSCSTQHLTPAAFDERLKEKKSPATPLLPALGEHRRVVLLADPGMGKSTLIQWLIAALIAPFRPVQAAPLGKAIPLPFILRDLVPLLPDDHREWSWSVLLKAFKDYKPVRTAAEALAAPLANDELVFSTLLQSDQAFFLIDGLDEIGDPDRRRAMRDALWHGFNAHPQVRFLITSRIVGYEEAEVHERPENGYFTGSFETVATLLYLAPFDDSQQGLFARNWYLPRLGEAAGTERAALFMEAVQRHPSTQVIGRVPNLLYLLALLYRHKAHLPDGRAQVYAAISDAYLEGITLARQLQHQPGLSVPYTLQEKESFLATIAMHMQVRRDQLAKEAKKKREEHSGEVLATSAELRQWLAPSFKGAQTPEDCTAVDEFVQFVARRAGLLLPRGEGVFAFAHLSFQEYYAARHLKAEFSRLSFGSDDPESLPVQAIQASYEKLIEWSRESAWREVFIFLVESQKEDVHITWALVQKVFLTNAAKEEARMPDQDGQPHRCLLFAAAELLASLSINRDVSLYESHRQKIWSSLWQTYLRWPFKFGYEHPWLISPTLLHTTPYRQQVVQALVEQAAGSTQLSLKGCSQLNDFTFLTRLPKLLTLDVSLCDELSSLEPLRASKLRSLYLYRCTRVIDLEPLHALPLQTLSLMSCKEVTSLEALRALPLQTLNIYGCTGVTSLEPLHALPLQKLYLSSCFGVTSLEPLRALPLQTLDLSGCTGVTSLEPLRALPLQTLNIYGCTGVTSLEPLRALPLQTLNLSGCTGVTSLEPLRALPLQTLNLSGCTGVTSLEPLSALPLQTLNLSGCTGVTSLEPLRALPLQSFDLSDCTEVTNLEPLRDLPLKSLSLNRCTGVTEAEVAALKVALPGCKITGP